MKTIRIGTYYPTSYEKVVDLEISDTLFKVMTQLDHKWNLIHRQDRRYHHRGGFIEGETEQRTRAQYRTIEDEVIQHDDAQRVREALSGLTDVQQRRVKGSFPNSVKSLSKQRNGCEGEFTTRQINHSAITPESAKTTRLSFASLYETVYPLGDCVR